MKKQINNLKIIYRKQLNDEYFILKLLAPEQLPEIMPGQFVQVLVPLAVGGAKSVFLRRPFSFHDVDDNTFTLFIKIKGEGTKILASLKENDVINTIYPLGKGFSLPDNGRIILIAGGIGSAPLLYLARYASQRNKDIKPTILIGAKTKFDIFELEEFEKYGEVHITTEDGSMGEKGLVTEHSVLKNVNEFKMMYSCGPTPMLKAVAMIAKNNNINCEVSLETTMACGFGACLCCVTETIYGNQCVCTEGPVFNVNVLK